MKHAIAKVRWLDESAGGRRRPVTALQYMSPAVIGGDEDAAPWTLVVHRSREEARAEETVLVHFLMDEAPHERLQPGVGFRLTEGPRVTGEGVVSEVFELSAAA
ncbi:hypothetical protein [Rubrivirga sp.]|uniref:hypothetical protein n=1 Tax=Rubrivirga sp. TaxID=1885344 RepID=UPI003B51593E